MSLRALRTLVAIAQHGSFARAAEAVHLTQSAVSLHVRSLEEEFNAPLFDRSKRLAVLTEAGHLAVERAREILSLYDSIAAELGDGSELRGRLKLGVIQTALAGVLPRALAALSRQHPQLRVNVTSGMSAELATRLDAGELDAAVTTEPVKPFPYSLVSTPLYQEGFWIIAPAGLDGSDPRRLLQEQPFIRFDRRAWAGRIIERELRRQRLRVQTSMELDSHTAIIQMVASGLGVAIMPLSVHDLDNLRDLIRLPFAEPQLTRQVVLLERRDRPAGRLAGALAETIRTQAGAWAIHED
ncbi:LysR substrate-binding domain-containing protein [Ectopseudomonas khazarica]|uniref:LysR substrate-binding domain-containing protein n=1 Tax=Ectopseudomonas khazarica TaxID=2502979 RepID=UPI002FE417D0